MKRWGIYNILSNSSNPPSLPPSNNGGFSFFSDGVLNASPMNVDFISDPDAWEKEFSTHMDKLLELLAKRDIDFNMIQDVFFTFSVMSHLLMLEVNSQPKATIGTILDSCFGNEIFVLMQNWSEQVPNGLHSFCQINLLKIYDSMLSNSNRHSHCVLVHKPILLPLLRLLLWCNETVSESNHLPSTIDKDFVVLLNQISRKMAQDTTLLHFLFNFQDTSSDGSMNTSSTSSDLSRSASESNRFLVFSLLIPYLYATGDIGQLAKDSLLAILSVSSKFDAVAEYIATSTPFCQVLSGGLSAIYSSLPRQITAALQTGPNWHKLIAPNDLLILGSLIDFHDSLLFLNAIVQNSHKKIKIEIVNNFYKGFLVEVMKFGIVQGETEELVSQIVYLNLMFENFTEEQLIHSLLKLLIREEWKDNEIIDLKKSMNTESPSHEDSAGSRMCILDYILIRMRESEALTNVTLSFLFTILNLVCEDLMWNQVFRHIINKVYISNPVTDFDSKKSILSAEQFLSFIPFCIKNVEKKDDGENKLLSKDSLEKHTACCRVEIIETSAACLCWKWPYDGKVPNKFLDIHGDSPPHSMASNFMRFGSARSSLMSCGGGNKYFSTTNRSAHTTLDTQGFLDVSGVGTLNELGEEYNTDSGDNEITEEDRKNFGLDDMGIIEEEYDEYDFLPLPENSSQFDQMTQSKTDYLHIAYDEFLSSDENESLKDVVVQKTTSYNVPANVEEIEENMECIKSTMNHLKIKEKCSVDDFLDKLKEVNTTNVPKTKNSKRKLEENIAFIESKLQYLKEIKKENEVNDEFDEEDSNPNHNIKLNLNVLDDVDTPESWTGVPITLEHLYSFSDPSDCGLLFNRLFELLEKLVENSYTTNLLLIAVLRTLLSYPQPILRAWLLYPSKNPNNLSPILHTMNGLKYKIDHYASTFTGFDALFERALKNLNKQAEACERNLRGNGKLRDFYEGGEELNASVQKVTSRATSSRKSGRFSNFFGFGRKSSNETINSSRDNDDSDLDTSRSSHFSTSYDITNGHNNQSTAAYRYFKHKALESKEIADDANHNKRVVYASICMTELAQMFAAFSLEHSITVGDAVKKYLR